MKSIWPARRAPRSAVALCLLAVPLSGCGLQEHPHPTPSAVSSGPKERADAGEPPRSSPDARIETPAGPPADGAAPPADGAPIAIDAAAPPVNGPGVMIGGTMVPREKVIVILHIGHSNMAGRALGPPDLKPAFYDTDAHLWQYQKGGVWKPAKEPLCPDGGTPGHPQGAGPGMALLRRALAAAPDAYVVSIGKGASLDFDASCFTFRKGGLYYDFVMAPALELKGKVTFGGVFTMLGYDGRTNPMAKNGGFIACLEGLAADYRAALGEPNLPFIAGGYESGATGTWSPACCGAPQVITQLALVPMRIPHSFLIPTEGIPMQDDHHYNLMGHHIWADRAFQGMADNGLLPWATAK
jgi:hypothetical protein